MNGKIKVTQRKMNKILDYISTYKCNDQGVVLMDKAFYEGISDMDKTEVNQILNALEDDNVIIKRPPSINYPCPTLRLTTNAFTYRMKQKRSHFRFWIPVAISILALLRPEITSFIKWIIALLQK
jgi:hypothetical protein